MRTVNIISSSLIYKSIMKCAVAIVLGFIGMAMSNPVPPLTLGHVYPASISSSYVNHGYPYHRVVVSAPVYTAPIIKTPIITTPVVTAPIIHTPVIKTPIITAPLWDSWGYGWGKH